MADNAARFAAEVVAYVAVRIGQPIAFVDDIPWRERERRLHAGTIHLCWICGLPYVHQQAHADPGIELLAAPVMAAARYGRTPVYFSEIVARKEIAGESLRSLAGLRLAYNEPISHSGYNVLCDALVRARAPSGLFSAVIESGAHQASIRMLLDGLVDVAVIDSTVLETELALNAEFAGSVRIVDSLGPSPMPPWVVSRVVPDDTKSRLLEALLGMHLDASGSDILARARMARFERVADAWYDPIRDMAARALTYPLSATHHALPTTQGYRLCPA
jgi:phosphonate transport system substrate-binding protein